MPLEGWGHVRHVHVDGDGALDQLERDDYTQAALLPLQHALKACERAGGDADAAASGQEGMRLGPQAARESRPDDLHFRIWERGRQSAKAHEPNDGRDLEHSQAILQREANKDVAGKERQFQGDATVFPAAKRRVKGKERLDAARGELGSYLFFLVGASVGSVPVRGDILLRKRGEAPIIEPGCR